MEYDAGQGVWADFSHRDCISLHESFESYRRKPEPKLRPWKPEEFVMDCVLSVKTEPHNYRYKPCCVNETSVFFINGCGKISEVAFRDLLNNYEHSVDGGKTWKPCGVEE